MMRSNDGRPSGYCGTFFMFVLFREAAAGLVHPAAAPF